jgi:hypothetical protein
MPDDRQNGGREDSVTIRISGHQVHVAKVIATGIFCVCGILLAFGVVWWPLYVYVWACIAAFFWSVRRSMRGR